MSDVPTQPPVPQQPGQSPPGLVAGPSGPRAGFGQRLVAILVDSIIIWTPIILIAKASGQEVFTSDGNSYRVEITGWPALLGLVLVLGYYAYFEGGRSGQTIGKRMMGIRVIDARIGTPIGYGRALLRFLGRIASTVVCLLGYLWMLWDKEKQTWHDKIATTLVVPTSAFPVR